MDEGLIARWRHGEPDAAPRMRRLISALIEAMWSDANANAGQDEPAGGALAASPDDAARLGRAVADVWHDGPAEWELVRRRSVWCCARQWAECLPRSADRKHPPVHAVVSAALRDPTDAPTELHRIVGAHSPDCESCSTILRVVRMMDYFSRTWTPPVGPGLDGPREVTVALRQGTDGVDGGGPAVKGAAKSTMFLRKRAPSKPRRTKKKSRAAEAALWPVVAVWVALAWWQLGPQDVAAPAQADLRYAILVDRTPPRPPPVSSLPLQARDVRRDLLADDCFTAAARGRGIQLKNPEHMPLAVLVAASMVCAGKGKEAVGILKPLLSRAQGGKVPWLMAQAHLLQGHPDAAVKWLNKVVRTDARLRPRAEALLSQIATARNSP